MEILMYIYLAWNVIVMLLYGWDKLCAIRGMRRVRETALFFAAFALGAVGAIFGMVLFNHKTGKIKFRLLVPLFVILNIAVIFIGVKYINGGILF